MLNTNDFNVGDKVRFLNAVGEGIITRIITRNKIMVMIDGFEIPCLSSDIMAVGSNARISPIPENNMPDASVNFVAKPAKNDLPGDDYEVSIAFLQPQNMQTDLFLLNDSTYQLYYCAGFCSNTECVQAFASGVVEADSKILLKTLPLKEVQNPKILWVEALFFKNIEFLPVKTRQAKYNFNPSDFSNNDAFTENDFFEDKALIYKMLSSKQLDEIQPESVSSDLLQKSVQSFENQQDVLISPKVVGKIDLSPFQKGTKNLGIAEPPNTLAPPAIEIEEIRIIDLRVVVLRAQLGFLNEKDLMQIQLERAEAGIEAVVQKQCNKCALIYGLGGKSTMTELQIMLNSKYPQMQVQDASQREYHYGALMVCLKTEH